MSNIRNKTIVYKSKHVMGGSPVFTGTRVPIETFLDYIQSGDSMDIFFAGFSKRKTKASFRIFGNNS